MTVALTHAEVMRTATRTGQLVRKLHGRPSIVIGIARSGTAPAFAFAEGSGADNTLAIRCSRPSSSGARGKIRALWVKLAPKPIRQLYKSLLFQTVVRLTDTAATTERKLPQKQYDQLASLLNDRDPGPVVVVDDSIDSGGTIRVILQAIDEIDAQANLIVFALASTLGRIVTEQQYTLVSGEIADFIDGDLSQLNDPELLGGAIEANDPKISTADQTDLQLFLDLDGTLTTDSFRDAANSLAWLYWQQGAYYLSIDWAVTRSLKKVRLVNHRFLQKALDRRIRALSPRWIEPYFSHLAHRLRQHRRPALATIATAPAIKAAIVTAALTSYRPAIEQAFGLPVISGSGPDHDDRWIEIGSDLKIETMSQWLKTHSIDHALLIGDTRVDALSSDLSVDVITIPVWDRTGLSTLLGASSWWQTK
jgi:adenine/guanine phosphoribosyltransferase-like PRPP-binding protein